jgi:hypothetical protein
VQSPQLPLRVIRVDFAMSAFGLLTLQRRTCWLAINPWALSIVQAPVVERRIMRYEVRDSRWTVIKPMLLSKPPCIPRMEDHRLPDGVFWVLR